VAKLDGPLFSLAAHGKFAKCLTYSRRPGVNVARFQRDPKYRKSDEQEEERDLFDAGLDWWDWMTPEEQAEFDGYNDDDP